MLSLSLYFRDISDFCLPALTILSDCIADLRSAGPTVVVKNFDCFFSLLRWGYKFYLSLNQCVLEPFWHLFSCIISPLSSFCLIRFWFIQTLHERILRNSIQTCTCFLFWNMKRMKNCSLVHHCQVVLRRHCSVSSWCLSITHCLIRLLLQ